MKKNTMAFIALIAGIFVGVAGMIIAPMGIIDSSVLYFTAQLLIFAATLVGCGEVIMRVLDIWNDIKQHRKL